MKVKYREKVRQALQSLHAQVIGHPDAVEGIEFFEVVIVPWHESGEKGRVIIDIPPEHDVPGFHQEHDSVLVEKWIGGSISIDAPQGEVTMPWWAGIANDDGILVIVCG